MVSGLNRREGDPGAAPGANGEERLGPMRRGATRRSLLALLAGAGLSGCAVGVERTTWPDITFQHLPPLPLGVAEIRFEAPADDREVAPPARDLRYAVPVSPRAAMARWSRERLRAAGGPGVAIATLTENRFVATPLETTGGVEGVFAIERAERYEGALAARVDVVGDPAGSGFASARAAATRTVGEDFSLNERERTLYDMLHGMVAALDARLEEEIRAHLARWVVAGRATGTGARPRRDAARALGRRRTGDGDGRGANGKGSGGGRRTLLVTAPNGSQTEPSANHQRSGARMPSSVHSPDTFAVCRTWGAVAQM